jgi:hypothetical protein
MPPTVRFLVVKAVPKPSSSMTERALRRILGSWSGANPVDVIWAEAPPALSFPIEDWVFCGPERTDEGVAYHRPGLHAEMGAWSWKNERGSTTTLALNGRDGNNSAQVSAFCMRLAALVRRARPWRGRDAVCDTRSHPPARGGAARAHGASR